MHEKRPKGNPEPISRLLAGGKAAPALGERLKDLIIWQQWEQVVGATIASRTRPVRCIGGVLTVVVSGGPWMQQLGFMKADLLARINGLFGEERIRELVFRTGSISQNNRMASTVALSLKPLSVCQQNWIREQVATAEDEDLRRAFQTLMESHYRRQ